MLADIPGGNGAEQGVGYGMQADIGIGMSGQRTGMRDIDTAKTDGSGFGRVKGVDVEAEGGAGFGLMCGHKIPCQLEVVRCGDFEIPAVAGNEGNRVPRCPDQSGVVGETVVVLKLLVGVTEQSVTETLGSL